MTNTTNRRVNRAVKNRTYTRAEYYHCNHMARKATAILRELTGSRAMPKYRGIH
jgi:hypothetical protein